MRRLLCVLAGLAVAAAAHAATPLYVCPDAPAEPVPGTVLVPWKVARHAGVNYANVFAVPGDPHIDALHKLDAYGDWLFSVEAANDLAGALATPADPRDLVRYTAAVGTYSLFFCGASLSGAIPAGVNVDAALLDGGDTGVLWVSFDVPATIGAVTFEPADLVAYRRTGAGCGGWTILPGNPVFDASAAGTGVPLSSNVVGAEKIGSTILLTFDVPTDLGPPGLATYTTDRVLAWNGASWSVWQPLAGWPLANAVDGLAWVGNPGRVPATLKLGKAAGNLNLVWTVSCSEGATDYGIYEGILGTWYSHVQIACTDTGADLTETIAIAPGNRYYLVVPHNAAAEGSYGPRSGGIERPAAAGACVAPQIVTPCP
jgi:hypothetical protein